MEDISLEEQYIIKLKYDTTIIKSLPDNFKNNKAFILKALDACSENTENYLKNFESSLFPYKNRNQLCKIYSTIFSNLSEELRDDKELVLKVVREYGDAIKYTSERLCDDRDVVLTAVQNPHYEFLLQYVSEKLKHDEEIIQEAIKNSEYTIESASEEIRDDRKIALEAVKVKGYIFKSLSERLRNDKEIALIALKSDSSASWHFPTELKKELKANDKVSTKEMIQYLEIMNMKESLQEELVKNANVAKKNKI
jgi:hypothetical protein